MTIKLLLALKKWALPIVILYAFALTVGSLNKSTGLPHIGFSFDDKIYHFLAYLVFTLLMFIVFYGKHIKNAILYSAIIVIIYGIIIEILQYTITTNRMLDIYDVFANTIGVLFAVIILKFKNKLKLK